MVATFAAFVDTGVGRAQALLKTALVNGEFHLFAINRRDQDVDIVQAIPVLFDRAVTGFDLRFGVAIHDQFGDGLGFVPANIAQVADMAGNVAGFQNIIVHQHEIADAAHRQA